MSPHPTASGRKPTRRRPRPSSNRVSQSREYSQTANTSREGEASNIEDNAAAAVSSSTQILQQASGDAADRLTDALELVENILSFLPSHHIVRARQVSSLFKNLIMTSPKLHRSIFTNSNHIFRYAGYDDPPGSMIYHGSWGKRDQFRDSRVRRIANVHPALLPLRLDSIVEVKEHIEITFDAGKLLHQGRYDRPWNVCEYVLSPGSCSPDFEFHGSGAAEENVYVNLRRTILTLGQLHARLAAEVTKYQKRFGKEIPLDVTLSLWGHVLEDDPQLLTMGRCWKLPGPKAGYVESEDEKALKAAVEKAGKWIIEKMEKMKQEQAAP